MSEKKQEKEKSLYEPIKRALERVFSCLGECYLEVTAEKKFSDHLKRVFDDVSLYMVRVESFYPDISGYVKRENSTDIIIVEVKPREPMVKDIFQAKDYAEVFNAKYAILASPRTISEERRRLIMKRKEIISRYPKDPVVLTQFRQAEEDFEIDKELYSGSLPEPFKSNKAAVEAEKLTFGSIKFTEKGNRGVYVVAENKGTSPVEITEQRFYGSRSKCPEIVIKPRESQVILLAKGWLPGSTFVTALITKNGKKYFLSDQSPGQQKNPFEL
jgi:hypothetical protein